MHNKVKETSTKLNGRPGWRIYLAVDGLAFEPQ